MVIVGFALAGLRRRGARLGGRARRAGAARRAGVRRARLCCVASRARTIEAVSGLMNLVMLPMWVLSGVFFASTNFPDAMQPFIQVLPLTALNDALRAIVNEGQSLAAVRARDRHPRDVGRAVVRRCR